jgi:hypothetical protein
MVWLEQVAAWEAESREIINSLQDQQQLQQDAAAAAAAGASDAAEQHRTQLVRAHCMLLQPHVVQRMVGVQRALLTMPSPAPAGHA